MVQLTVRSMATAAGRAGASLVSMYAHTGRILLLPSGLNNRKKNWQRFQRHSFSWHTHLSCHACTSQGPRRNQARGSVAAAPIPWQVGRWSELH